VLVILVSLKFSGQELSFITSIYTEIMAKIKLGVLLTAKKNETFKEAEGNI
jgi:hypothetical protein